MNRNHEAGMRRDLRQMSDECILRAKARETIRARKLPNRCPDRTWGGPGDGACCAICNVSVSQDEVELEIEFFRGSNHRDPDKYHVHVHCFAAWELERHLVERPAEAIFSGNPPRRPLPEPPDTGSITRRERYTQFKRGPA